MHLRQSADDEHSEQGGLQGRHWRVEVSAKTVLSGQAVTHSEPDRKVVELQVKQWVDDSQVTQGAEQATHFKVLVVESRFSNIPDGHCKGQTLSV